MALGFRTPSAYKAPRSFYDESMRRLHDTGYMQIDRRCEIVFMHQSSKNLLAIRMDDLIAVPANGNIDI